MPSNAAARDGRIELRATRDEERLLAAAAAHERLDVTGFIMRTVLPAAREIVDNAERIRLSERDTIRVLELLENPPTPALLAAARRGHSVPLAWREEPIARYHDRKAFDCSSSELNDFLTRFTRQNHDSGGAKTFVAVTPAEPSRVLGFYAISPGVIEFTRVPGTLTGKLGRCDVPVFRVGRLAIDRSVQGQGLAAI